MKGIDWLDVCLEIFSDYIARERFDKPNSIIFAELHQHILTRKITLDPILAL